MTDHEAKNNDISSEDQVNKNMELPRNCKIVIIGAGMAGLSAANHLLRNGIKDFVILEGRNRVGGRIVAITIGKFNFLKLFLICNDKLLIR